MIAVRKFYGSFKELYVSVNYKKSQFLDFDISLKHNISKVFPENVKLILNQFWQSYAS